MKFDQFLNLVDKIYYANEFELRHGQTIMNALYQVWPEKYHEISKSKYDCFYDDGIVSSTLDKLKNEWYT